MGPQPYSGERRGAVRAAAKLERKICIFCHPRPASARAWLSGYLVLDLSWTLSRSSDTGTWRQLADNLETTWLEAATSSCTPYVQGVAYIIQKILKSPILHDIYATPCIKYLDTEQAIFTQLSEPLFGAWCLVSPCAEIMRD